MDARTGEFGCSQAIHALQAAVAHLEHLNAGSSYRHHWVREREQNDLVREDFAACAAAFALGGMPAVVAVINDRLRSG